jgi:hypothetical protein
MLQEHKERRGVETCQMTRFRTIFALIGPFAHILGGN